VTVTNTTLHGIIRTSYGLEDFQVVGGPDWVNTDRWDIIAKAADNAVTSDLDLMLRSLLTDRFKLHMHNEIRQFPVLALVRARSDRLGSSIQVSTADCASVACGFSGVAGNLAAKGRTLGQFARVLTPLVGRAVVDKTGTNEMFDWSLKWAPDTARTSADGPSLVTALQEQLGLRLEQQDARMSVLVIDSVEQASDN
jgi:uncharacterized protein (TIGR03435 family)